LIGLNKNSNLGIESAYKYFVQSSVATIIGFFGISLIYMSVGTLNLNELSILMMFNDTNWLFILGIYFITSTIFFKLGIFPLHSWIPDVYQGALLISVIFIAILPKIAYVVLFFKLFIEFHSIINNYCLLFSLLSIFYGSVISLYQTNFRRLLAYGSMVHMGLIVYSISLFTVQSIAAAFFYLVSYIILMLFTFSFMFFLFEKKKHELYYLDSISQFNSLIGNKFLVFSFSLILFSLAGLPFFLGFISKWYIFLSLLNNYNYFELFLLLGISVLSASYYIRLIRFIFFSENKIKKVKLHTSLDFSFGFYDLLVFLIFLNIFIILIHNTVYLFILQYIIISYL
jgi:NADH-quinone oxidoreductase subunit N